MKLIITSTIFILLNINCFSQSKNIELKNSNDNTVLVHIYIESNQGDLFFFEYQILGNETLKLSINDFINPNSNKPCKSIYGYTILVAEPNRVHHFYAESDGIAREEIYFIKK